jgi:hypothetical protein
LKRSAIPPALNACVIYRSAAVCLRSGNCPKAGQTLAARLLYVTLCCCLRCLAWRWSAVRWTANRSTWRKAERKQTFCVCGKWRRNSSRLFLCWLEASCGKNPPLVVGAAAAKKVSQSMRYADERRKRRMVGHTQTRIFVCVCTHLGDSSPATIRLIICACKDHLLPSSSPPVAASGTKFGLVIVVFVRRPFAHHKQCRFKCVSLCSR